MGKSEQGVLNPRYVMVPRTLSFIFRGSRVLLIKGAPTKRLWAGLYNGIGGHIERGEDVIGSGLRELREETGIAVKNYRLVGTVLVDASDEVGVCVFVLRGDYWRGELVHSTEGTLEWLEVEQLPKLPCVADVPALVQRVSSMGVDEVPFSARSFYDEQEKLTLRFFDGEVIGPG